MLTVHVRVNDAATNKPTPVRIRFVDEHGQCHVPLGRLESFAEQPGVDVGGHVRIGSKRFSYIDGACEIRLPTGPILIEGFKGVEYESLQRDVTLGPGQISLRLAIERWIDLRQEGWYSGDYPRACAAVTTRRVLALEGAAEDIAVVNLLAEETRGDGDKPVSLPNLLAFSGSSPALETPGHLVVVNTINTHPLLGTVALLRSHRPVYPLPHLGAPGLDDWSVADWCDQCHRKRGLVVWPDLPRVRPDAPQGEALAALILGKIDAFEISQFPKEETLANWYRLLNCGYRLPLVGGSGKNSNTTVLGAVRTYARLEPGSEFNYGNWIEAVRLGRTFATGGPVLTLAVEGREPGSVLDLSAGESVVRIHAQMRGPTAGLPIEILYNGQVIDSQRPMIEGVHFEAKIKESGWFAARTYLALYVSSVLPGRRPTVAPDSGHRKSVVGDP